MKIFTSAVLLSTLVCVTSASAENLPKRKAGLWELTTSNSGNSQVMQQCTDANTDEKMQEMAQGAGGIQGALGISCTKKEFRKEGNALINDSVCTMMGTTITAKSVITGDFNTAYVVETDASYNPPLFGNAGGKSKIEGKYIGACKPGQRPGDLVMPGGRTMNIDDMNNMMKNLPLGKLNGKIK